MIVIYGRPLYLLKVVQDPPLNLSIFIKPVSVLDHILMEASKRFNKILRQLSRVDLPGKEHVEGYLRHMARRNRRPRTMYSRWGTILIFLGMLRANGKTRLEEVTRRDVEAFIEHEQDRGIKITTIQDETYGCSVLSPPPGGRRDRFSGCFWQKDTLAVAGAAATGHGSR